MTNNFNGRPFFPGGFHHHPGRYQTSLPMTFDDTLTQLQKMNMIIGHLNHMNNTISEFAVHIENTDQWTEKEIAEMKLFIEESQQKITKEIETFEKNMYELYLPSSVEQTLDGWLANGTIEDIINNQIYQEMNEKINLLNNRVAHISIDDFEDEVVNGDWALALQKAVDSITKGVITFSDRIYEFKSRVTLKSQISLEGNGMTSIIKANATDVFFIPERTQYYGTIKGLQIDGTLAPQNIGVYAPFVRRITFDDIWIYGFDTAYRFVDGIDLNEYTGYITFLNPRINNNSNCGIDLGFYDGQQLVTNQAEAIRNLASQIVILGSGWINHNGVGVYMAFGQNVGIDGVDLSANTVTGVYCGSLTKLTTIKNAWHEFGAIDDVILHDNARVTIEDTRTFSHAHGDSGVIYNDKGRSNLLSDRKILAEGNGWIAPKNAVINGSFKDWDNVNNKPNYWFFDGLGTNFDLEKIEDDNLVTNNIMKVKMLNGGGRILNKFYVAEKDVGNPITLTFDYKCVGDPTTLTQQFMFIYRVVKVNPNSSTEDAGITRPLTKWARYTSKVEKACHTAIPEEPGLYGIEISFRSWNVGQSTMDFEFTNFNVCKSYFSNDWTPSILDNPDGVYYTQTFIGKMPSQNIEFYKEMNYNGNVVKEASIVVSGGGATPITVQPSIRAEYTRLYITPGDAIDCDYIITLKYLPTIDSHGCVETRPTIRRAPYLI